MTTLQNAFYAKKLGDSSALDAVVNSEINAETLFYVIGDQAVRASLRSKSDIKTFRKDLIAVEKAEDTTFSIGVIPNNKK
ncbi:unnamed protein product [Cylicocyclus nassatus]|uniref:Uncharacterized protein n=1 Tax=Cylicocyclus nassatus TaxID=53992 RepID=A0AA36H497_CYLNA|nr:unnamed protein product [Cylicocyclus nassatus]